MKRIILLILIFFILNVSFGQKKVVLRKGIQKNILKIGKEIGITNKGEDFKYSSWKNSCSTKNNNIWIIDSIKTNFIVVRRLLNDSSAYIYDTIPEKNKKLIRKYSKDWIYVTSIKTLSDNYLSVYKYPKEFERKKVAWNNIQSLTFAKQKNCEGFSIFVPLASVLIIIMTPIVAESVEPPIG